MRHRSPKIPKSMKQDLHLRASTLAAKKYGKHIDSILGFKYFYSNLAGNRSKKYLNLRNISLMIYFWIIKALFSSVVLAWFLHY